MILLFRHTQTELNKAGRFQGFTDSPLTSTGIEQANNLNKLLLKNFGSDYSDFVFYSSPSPRCLFTSQIIFKNLKRGKIQITDSLREQDFGIWEGLKSIEIEKKWPFAWGEYLKNERFYRPINGESFLEVKEGIKDFILTIDLSKPIIIFTHKYPSVAIRELLIGEVFKYHPQDTFYQIDIDNKKINTYSSNYL